MKEVDAVMKSPIKFRRVTYALGNIAYVLGGLVTFSPNSAEEILWGAIHLQDTGAGEASIFRDFDGITEIIRDPSNNIPVDRWDTVRDVIEIRFSIGPLGLHLDQLCNSTGKQTCSVWCRMAFKDDPRRVVSTERQVTGVISSLWLV